MSFHLLINIYKAYLVTIITGNLLNSQKIGEDE
ncbi:hypothetical protein Psfp_02195 [Pelotomaculum sp. FP]|nr:hypothetical protein Psfp_02195 [Pelotomaculum sp. FP]